MNKKWNYENLMDNDEAEKITNEPYGSNTLDTRPA